MAYSNMVLNHQESNGTMVTVFPEISPKSFNAKFFSATTTNNGSHTVINPITQSSSIASTSYWPIKASWCAYADKLEGATKAEIIASAQAGMSGGNVGFAQYCGSIGGGGGSAGVVKTMCANDLHNVWATYRNNLNYAEASCADCSYVVPTAAAVVGLLYNVLSNAGVNVSY